MNSSPKKVRIFVTKKCIFSTYTKNAASTVSTWEQVYLKKLKGVHALDSYWIVCTNNGHKKRQFFKWFFCLKVLFKDRIFNLLQMNFDAKKRQKSIIIFTLAPKTKYMKYCIMRLFWVIFNYAEKMLKKDEMQRIAPHDFLDLWDRYA